MQAVSATQLRANMKKYLDQVTENSEVLVVSRSADDEAVVILSLQEFNALHETSRLLSSTQNRRRLQESISQIAAGKIRAFKI